MGNLCYSTVLPECPQSTFLRLFFHRHSFCLLYLAEIRWLPKWLMSFCLTSNSSHQLWFCFLPMESNSSSGCGRSAPGAPGLSVSSTLIRATVPAAREHSKEATRPRTFVIGCGRTYLTRLHLTVLTDLRYFLQVRDKKCGGPPGVLHHMSPRESSWQCPGGARREPFSDAQASRRQLRRSTKENGAEFRAHRGSTAGLERNSSLQNWTFTYILLHFDHFIVLHLPPHLEFILVIVGWWWSNMTFSSVT